MRSGTPPSPPGTALKTASRKPTNRRKTVSNKPGNGSATKSRPDHAVTSKRRSKQMSSINEQAEWSSDPVSDHAVIELASGLDDFIDKEVVDKQDMAVGKLACYWQSRSGRLIFLGIKGKGHE